MDGWVDGWTDGRTEEWMDGIRQNLSQVEKTSEATSEHEHYYTNVDLDVIAQKVMDRQTSQRMDGWTGVAVCISSRV